MFNDNGSFLLALFEFFLFFAWFMCLFWVLGDIFRSRDLGGGAKTAWVIFVIIIPWLGLLVYLIARGHGMQERQLEQVKEAQAAQAEYIKSVAAPSSGNAASQIADAKGLLDSGAINQAEFDQIKAKALASLITMRTSAPGAYRSALVRLSCTTRKARCATGAGTRSRSPSKRQVTSQPAPGRAGDHLVDQREVGPGADLRGGAAEQLDQPLEVLGALPRGLRDRGEGLLRARRVGVDESLPGGRLDHHHADRVADDVVQLAGDAGSFVAQRDLGEELPLVLELLRAHGELRRRSPCAVAARCRRRTAGR